MSGRGVSPDLFYNWGRLMDVWPAIHGYYAVSGWTPTVSGTPSTAEVRGTDPGAEMASRVTSRPAICRVHPCMTILPAGRVLCWFHRRGA